MFLINNLGTIKDIINVRVPFFFIDTTATDEQIIMSTRTMMLYFTGLSFGLFLLVICFFNKTSKIETKEKDEETVRADGLTQATGDKTKTNYDSTPEMILQREQEDGDDPEAEAQNMSDLGYKEQLLGVLTDGTYFFLVLATFLMIGVGKSFTDNFTGMVSAYNMSEVMKLVNSEFNEH